MLPTDTRPIIRPCRDGDFERMLVIINAAADKYRGAIPADCWHEPYMPAAELRAEKAAKIDFVGCEDVKTGELVGVMGIQRIRNVDLIRHAYALPSHQGCGIGSALIAHLRARTNRQVLIGTWSAAVWAIHFYERHGFRLVPETTKTSLLQTYWTVSPRQIETSVVLAAPALTVDDAANLIADANSRS